MKYVKHTKLVVAFLLFTYHMAIAQTERPNGISARVLFIDNYTMQGGEIGSFEDITNGLEIAYNRLLSDRFYISIPLKAGIYNMIGQENNNTFFGLDGTFRYRLTKPQSRFIPYVFTGLGSRAIESQSLDFQVPGGLGLDIKIGPSGYISLQGEYRHSLNLEYHNLEVGVGFTYWIGKKKKEEEEEVKKDLVEILDRDQDGVVDSLDQCPDVAGIDTLMGCPDTDGDGIIDSLDLCPEHKGTKANQGCPITDMDGDGFTDGRDECPDVPGEANGCPDSDGDGVADIYDKCPNIKGTSETGCPVVKDSDGDGIPDDEDQCPYFKGSALFMGCPDTDNDGVHDGIDRCPSIKGTKENLGCPGITSTERDILEYAVTNVTFKTGSDELEAQSFEILDKIAQIMRNHPEYDLRIKGHTDNVGKAYSNQVLSEKRARTCYQYLQEQGISATKMNYEGFGESRPINNNDSERERRRNRRVEFELYFK